MEKRQKNKIKFKNAYWFIIGMLSSIAIITSSMIAGPLATIGAFGLFWSRKKFGII